MKIRLGRVLRERAKFTYLPRFVEDNRMSEASPRLIRVGWDRVRRV